MQRDFRTSCRACSGRVDAGGVEAHFSLDRRPSGPAIFPEFQPHAQRQSQSIVDAVRRLPGLMLNGLARTAPTAAGGKRVQDDFRSRCGRLGRPA